MNQHGRVELALSDTADQASSRPVLTLAVSLAAVLLALSLFVSNASTPLPQEILSAGLILLCLVCMISSGARSANLWFVLAPLALAGLLAAGVLGPIENSGPAICVILGAGASAAIGWINARRDGRMRTLLQVFCWSASAVCAASILAAVFMRPPGGPAAPPIELFGAPEQATLLLGLLALFGVGSAAQSLRDIHGRKLPRAALFETGLVRASGGLTLLAASLACLVASRLTPGHLMSLGAVILLLGWDLSAFIPSRARNSSQGLRLGLLLAGLLLAAAGVVLAVNTDEAIAPGTIGAASDSFLQRWSVYWRSWLDSPWTGHGLSSAPRARDESMTLYNAVTLQAPGGARNAPLQWLVETGVIGAGLLIAALALPLIRMIAAYVRRRRHASFPRFALCVVLLMALHGSTHSSLDSSAAIWLAALILGAAVGSLNLSSNRRSRRVLAAGEA